jgi:hypothetical protein
VVVAARCRTNVVISAGAAPGWRPVGAVQGEQGPAFAGRSEGDVRVEGGNSPPPGIVACQRKVSTALSSRATGSRTKSRTNLGRRCSPPGAPVHDRPTSPDL